MEVTLMLNGITNQELSNTYINKDTNRVTAKFSKSTMNDDHDKEADDVNIFYDCRYISPCEATWRHFTLI